MRRFFVPISDNAPERISFSSEETRHLQKVLRISVGDKINVFDGNGNEYHCEISEFGKRNAYAIVVGRVEPTAMESSLEINLGVALIKGDKFDLVIQKAVELGVTSLLPLTTIRSDVKAKNFEKKLERWQKIVIEASKQCGRATLMKISAPSDFNYFAENAKGSKVMFSERDGDGFSEIKPDKNITAVVGPEGGWDNSEIELALKNGFQVITLGGRILRAETAAISIAAILQNQFGDIN